MEQRELERFVARSDDGQYECTIIVLLNLVPVPSNDDPNATRPGSRELKTETGFDCNDLGEDLFEIVNDPLHPGVIVRRVAEG